MITIQTCKLLNFDSSTNSTGWSLYENRELFNYGDINCSHIKNTDERIKNMILKIYELINKMKPRIIATEMTVVPRNVQAQRNLTMILGAIYGKCIMDNIFYYSFRPSEWRGLISTEKKPRKRIELKEWSKAKCKELFNIQDINDDISDAILLGKAYITMFSENK